MLFAVVVSFSSSTFFSITQVPKDKELRAKRVCCQLRLLPSFQIPGQHERPLPMRDPSLPLQLSRAKVQPSRSRIRRSSRSFSRIRRPGRTPKSWSVEPRIRSSTSPRIRRSSRIPGPQTSQWTRRRLQVNRSFVNHR